jgi:hypothetical protein
VKKDYIHEFGVAAETAAHRRQVAHDSVVLEQYTGVDRDIMDTITIGQLPDDYGSWSGSAPYGFNADANARIRVWWAGSGTGLKEEDEAYKPASAAEPTADAHHKLVGEWTVPARNGVYKVGGGKITLQESGQSVVQTVANGVDIIAEDDSETGYYVFIYDFPGSSRAPAFKSSYDDPWERSFVEVTPPNIPSISTNVTKGEVAQGESFADVAKIVGSLASGSYVTFTAFDAVKGSPDASAARLLNEVRVNFTPAQILQSQSQPVEITSPSTSTNTTGNVYWKVSLWNPAGELLDSHALGIESETVSVRGVSVATQVSSDTVYANERFRDTARIEGKVARGSYVVFDAYNPVSGAPDTNAGKLLDSARVNVTDVQADGSAWNTSFTVVSPEVSAASKGKVYWRATVYRADGFQLATHALGVAGETVTVQYPSLTTLVSDESTYPGISFRDAATVAGRVARGSYVVFAAYDAVSGAPDTNAGKLLDAVRVNVTDVQADASGPSTQFVVNSPYASTLHLGNVYWQASLHAADGTLLASHELGVAGETVHVKAPLLETQTSRSVARPGETFRDAATITGQVPSGSYVTFTAYDAVQGDPDTNAVKLLDEARVNLTAEQVTDSATTPVTVLSAYTSTDTAGSVYWRATLRAADGTVIASHELGLPSKTVHIAPGGIVTSNAQKFGAVGEQLYDEITVYDESLQSESPDNREHQGEGNSNDGGTVGRIPQGSTVTVIAYRQGDDDNGNSGIYKLGSKTITLDTNLFEALKAGQQGNRPGKLTLKVTDPSFVLDKAGMVYWQTELRTAQGGVLDKHDYGEWNADHETGYTSFERTPVQRFDTTVSKKWLSSNEASYEDATV